MKYLTLLFLLFTLSCCKEEKEDSQDIFIGKQAITGILEATSNPCISEPCLPGLVLAVSEKSFHYIILLDNHWISEPEFSFNEVNYEIGDSISVEGDVYKKKDMNLNEYYEIQINSGN